MPTPSVPLSFKGTLQKWNQSLNPNSPPTNFTVFLERESLRDPGRLHPAGSFQRDPSILMTRPDRLRSSWLLQMFPSQVHWASCTLEPGFMGDLSSTHVPIWI